VEGYVSEQEQVEVLKKWWRENGSSVILGIAVGLAGLGGWRYWETRTQNVAMQASSAYEQLLGEVQKNDNKAAIAQGEAIVSNFASTPYAGLAALEIARIKVENGDATAARAHLQWVMDNAKTSQMQRIGRLRLARVLLAGGDTDGALSLLRADPEPGAFDSEYQEVMGDIYQAKGDVEQARSAYTKAQEMLDPTETQRAAILQMKVADLGTAPAQEPAP